MSVQLLGIGEASFHRFLAALVNLLAGLGKSMPVDAFLAVLPDMPGQHLCVVGAAGALHQQRTAFADARIRLVLPITDAIGGAVAYALFSRTDIHIRLPVINILAFVKVTLFMVRPTIADHTVQTALFETLADRRGQYGVISE